MKRMPQIIEGEIILLHAGKTWSPEPYPLNEIAMNHISINGFNGRWCVRGKIILAAQMADTIEYESMEHFQEDQLRHCISEKGYFPGIKGWVIQKLWKVDPIDFRGMPGLSSISSDVEFCGNIPIISRDMVV